MSLKQTLLTMFALVLSLQGYCATTLTDGVLNYEVKDAAARTLIVKGAAVYLDSLLEIPAKPVIDGVEYTVVDIKFGSQFSSLYKALRHVVVPNTVTRISSIALHYSATNSIIEFEEGSQLRVICDGAFSGLRTSTINLPSTVDSIGARAFKGSDLTAIKLPASLKTLNAETFLRCKKLQNVIFPAGLDSIGESVFSGCISLRKIVLPDGVRHLSASTFSMCDSLEEVQLSANMQTIGVEAFKDCKNLKYIKLPEKVETIYENAFRGSGLTKVDLPPLLKMIDNYGFYDVPGLKEITLPASLETIGHSAIRGIDKVYPLGAVPPTIGYENVFNSTEVIVPLEYLDVYSSSDYWCSAFVHATEVSIDDINYAIMAGGKAGVIGNTVAEGGRMEIKAAVTIDGKDYAVSSIKDYALTGMPSELIVKANVSTIGSNHKFYVREEERDDINGIVRYTYFSNLKTIELPSTIKGLGYQQFAYCVSLKELTTPSGLLYLSHKAFYYCTALEKINLPEGLSGIDESVFEGCKSLAEISLPSSCVRISSKAFSGTSLSSITISGAVKDISPTAFSGCEKLENIYVLNKEADYYDIAGVLYLKPSVDYQIDKNGVNCKDKQLLHTYPGGRKSVEYTIEEGTFAIMEGAFNKNKNLSKVILPEGMIVLNGFAESSISEIELPSTVQIIQDKAFYGTKNLRSISLPASIEKIGNFAFAESTLKFMNVEALTPPLIYIEAIPNNIVVNVKTESYPSYLKEWESCELICGACYDDTFIYNIIDNNGTLDLICSRKPLSGNVIIPSTLKAEDELREVREIHQNSFSNENLNSITIPATVTRIGKNAFFYNPELESVTFEDGSNLEFVDDWAFAFEGSLKEFNIPSKAHVSALSLWGNSLSKITVDEKNPWHTVSGGVLYSKAMDTLQVFPRTVVQDKFVLPASVSVMATNDFMLYNNVNNIYVFADTPPTIDSLLNINLDLIKTDLYVKESALEAYKNSDWKTCHNIIPMTDDEIDSFLTAISDVDTGRVADRGDGAYYTLSGVRVDKPAKGLYIRNGRKVVVR